MANIGGSLGLVVVGDTIYDSGKSKGLFVIAITIGRNANAGYIGITLLVYQSQIDAKAFVFTVFGGYKFLVCLCFLFIQDQKFNELIFVLLIVWNKIFFIIS
ncbi:hypothetical protein [Moraxella marmotae]|uniref:hypothetical protein n=1 Tax=Moraxella marmotae TaxID=3344520 RepID=UPI0035F30DD0